MFNNLECDESQPFEYAGCTEDTACNRLLEEVAEVRSARPAKEEDLGPAKQRSAFTVEFNKKEAENLLDKLGDKDSDSRDSAQKSLQQMGRQVVPMLRKAETDSTNPAVKLHASRAIEWIERTARKEEYEIAKDHYPHIVKVFRHGGVPTDFSERNIKPTPVPKNEQAAIEKMLDSANQLTSQPEYTKALGKEPAIIKNGVSEQYLEEYHKRYLSWHMAVDGERLYATSLAHGDDADRAKSRSYLSRCVEKNSSLVDDEEFLAVARKAEAGKDPVFVAAFLRNKGTLDKLEAKAAKK